VVEQGFSRERSSVSVGVIVQNTSRSVAYHTTIAFQLLDGNGRIVPDTVTPQQIPILLPGERVGFGSDFPVSSPVASVRPELGPATWLAADALGADYQPVTGTYLRTLRPNPTDKATVDIHYQQHSPGCADLSEGETSVVFRNAGGAIVGGTTTAAGTVVNYTNGHGVSIGGELKPPAKPACSHGDSEQWIIPASAPATATDNRTELYPQCDLLISLEPGH
jgi:hypothetical protein